jgi:hypothetical protein
LRRRNLPEKLASSVDEAAFGCALHSE